MRKLVTIRRISEILPIADADMIERAKIDGWNVVVKNGEFRVGDLCVYGEIDSVFPVEDERFAFLEGKHLKTKKMRGVVSQGIAFSTAILDGNTFIEGDDVTERLGVTKYEPPPPKSMEAKGEFPWFIPKTDAERVQNLIEDLESNAGQTAYLTEKIDGSSITIYCRLNENVWEAGVCSRNLELKLDVENYFTNTVRKLQIIEKLKDYCQTVNRQIALQGELTGIGIQGNKYKLEETNIFFFNVFDIREQKKVSFAQKTEIIERLKLKAVPILDDSFILHTDVDRYLREAEGKSKLNEKIEREGIIVRTLDGNFDFKAISNRFLLKND